MVNFGVQEATNQPAGSNQQHRNQGGRTIDRTQCKVGVIQDSDRADNAQHHMHAKPVLGRPEELEKSNAFA